MPRCHTEKHVPINNKLIYIIIVMNISFGTIDDSALLKTKHDEKYDFSIHFIR